MTRLLVTGTTGFLGHYVLDACRERGIECVAAGRSAAAPLAEGVESRTCDLATPADLAAQLGTLEGIDGILHVAALSAMGACARDPDLAARVNTESTAVLAGLGLPLVFASTDLVFDGRGAPYLPTAVPRPLSVYGATKARGEEAVLRHAGHVVVRLPLLFGPSFDGERGATDMLQPGRPLRLYTNEFRTPLHCALAAEALLDAFALTGEVGRGGILHAAGPTRLSRWEFAIDYARRRGLDSSAWAPSVCVDATRPRDVSLVVTR